MFKYKSICVICGKETCETEGIADHHYAKSAAGYITVQLSGAAKSKTLNFCPSCARKYYTIEELQTIGNYNQWSY